MAVLINEIAPVAHLPLVLGMLRKLEVAAVIDAILPPVPRNVLSCGRGVEAVVLAILDGHHALYKVGKRLEERGMLALLQADLTRAALNDYRLGQILDALFAANLNRVFGAVALKALAVYAIPTPWLHQDTTTIALYGAYEDEPETPRAIPACREPASVPPDSTIATTPGRGAGPPQSGRLGRAWGVPPPVPGGHHRRGHAPAAILLTPRVPPTTVVPTRPALSCPTTVRSTPMLQAMIALPSTPSRAPRCHRVPRHFLLRPQLL